MVAFNGKNYDLWEKAVTMALKEKNKLGFIDGTKARSISKPTVKRNNISELQAQEMVNSMPLLMDTQHD